MPGSRAPGAGTGAGGASFGAAFALPALLLIQILVGYVWLMSGLAKIVRGGFPDGLEEELREGSPGRAGWYESFLEDAVYPNARAFGYLIEASELSVGVVLVATALAWLLVWDRLAPSVRRALLVVAALAALGGVFMNLNFHLANGSAHPWLVPADGFDEGVDLDSIMPAVQLVLVAVNLGALRLQRADPIPIL